MPHISDHADYGHPRTGDDSQTLTDRVFIGPIQAGHRLVNDYVRSRLRIGIVRRVGLLVVPANEWQSYARIRVRKEPALTQRNLQRPKVVVADYAGGSLLLLSGRRRGSAFDRKGVPIVARSQWRICGCAHGLDTGQAFQPFDQLFIKCLLLLCLPVLQTGQRKIKPQHLVWIKSGIDPNQTNKALKHESTTNKQDYGQGNFDDYQRGADPPPRGAGRAPHSLSHPLMQMKLGRPPGGRDSSKQTRKD